MHAGTGTHAEQHLISDGLVARYHTVPDVDGLPPGEGAVLLCGQRPDHP